MPGDLEEPAKENVHQDQLGEVVMDEGSQADTEWSDQDLDLTDQQDDHQADQDSVISARSLLAEDCESGIEQIPRLEIADSMKTRKGRKGKLSGQISQGNKRPNGAKYDAVDFIMDKIDAELYGLTRGEVQRMSKRRPSKQQRSDLKDQGVEFDTGDETNQDSTRVRPDSLGKLHRSHLPEKDEGDTGLGTGSMDGDSEQDPHIIGKADIYASESSEDEDGAEKDTPRYEALDSDMAKQLDEKYKHILTSKNKDSGKPMPKMKSRPSFKPGSKKSRHLGGGGHSDMESVMTEDYENQFHNVMVKQVANVPIMTFDKFIVDSDVDTVQSQYIRERFHAALSKSLCSDSDGASSDGESSNMEALIEKKFQEIIRKTAIQITEGVESSGTDTTGKGRRLVMNGGSEGDEALHNTWPRNKPSRRSRKAPDYRQKMRQHDENAELELGEEARQMERESARMRQEMESERKRGRKQHDSPAPKDRQAMSRSLPVSMTIPNMSAARLTAPKTVDHQVSMRLQQELSKLQGTIHQARRDKQNLQLEMKQIQNEIKQHESDKKNAERQMKENRARAEDARTELMLAEFKRDSARKELDSVQQDLEEKKQILGKAAAEAELVDQSTESFEQVVAEREELQLRVRNLEQLERERKELERQLASTKDNLIIEQKRFREKFDALREERATELEEVKAQLQAELAAARSSSGQEMMEVRQQLQEVTDRLAHAHSEQNRKDEENMKLREQLLEVQQRVAVEGERKVQVQQEAQQNINALVKEKEQTLSTVIKEAEVEKQEALEQLTSELSHQHKQLMSQLEGRLHDQLTDAHGQAAAKEMELEVLRDRLVQQEENSKSLNEKIRNEAQERFCRLMKEERERWESEKERELDQELDIIRDESEKTSRQLHDELASERDMVENQIKHVTQLKKELEEARQTNRNIYRDKLSALNQAKESAELNKERQLDVIKEKIEQETQRSMDRLRETIRHQEDELQRLRQDNLEMKSVHQDGATSIENLERAVIEEMNEECRRTAHILGISARTVSTMGFSSWTPGRVVSAQSKPNLKAALNAAVNNMKLTNDELRKGVQDIQDHLEQKKGKLGKYEREKKEEFDKLKQKMQNEKIAALETLKDRLIKEHLDEVDKFHRSLGKGKSMDHAIRAQNHELQEIQRNMNKWKDQTTGKLAIKFQEEMNREMEKRMKELKKKEREWEREKASLQREIEKLTRDVQRANSMQNTSVSSPARVTISAPSGGEVQVRQLQGKVKQLQTENFSLRRSKLAASVPDLSMLNTSLNDSALSLYPTKEDHSSMRQLELQTSRAENRAKLAEERAEKNEKILNQKILELSKLQGTLTQQTKELMQLERSYSQLQRPLSTQSPLRSASPLRTPSRPSSRLGYPR